MKNSHVPFPSSTDDMVGKIADSTHDIVDQVAQKTRPAVNQLRDAAGNAVDTLAEKAVNLQKMERKMLFEMVDTIRTHPFASIAAALACGMMIGRLRTHRE